MKYILTALLASCLLTALNPLQARAAESDEPTLAVPMFPLEELRAGMKGLGYTVIRGIEVETFNVEVLELIADGRHVNLDLVTHVMRCAPGRVALITDAMAAAGAGDGCYRLGEHEVEVCEGAAHLRGTQVLAGSTLTLDEAVQTVVAAGVPLAQAVKEWV